MWKESFHKAIKLRRDSRIDLATAYFSRIRVGTGGRHAAAALDGKVIHDFGVANGGHRGQQRGERAIHCQAIFRMYANDEFGRTHHNREHRGELVFNNFGIECDDPLGDALGNGRRELHDIAQRTLYKILAIGLKRSKGSEPRLLNLRESLAVLSHRSGLGLRTTLGTPLLKAFTVTLLLALFRGTCDDACTLGVCRGDDALGFRPCRADHPIPLLAQVAEIEDNGLAGSS